MSGAEPLHGFGIELRKSNGGHRFMVADSIERQLRFIGAFAEPAFDFG